MCCCDAPTVNGTFGYKWNEPHGPASVYPVNAPALEEYDTLIYDEPGRCGGQDSHSFHYRVVSTRFGGHSLLVRHGGGNERIPLSNGKAVLGALAVLGTDGRYWILNSMYHAQSDAARESRKSEAARWSTAAAEKRIKVRKQRGTQHVKVSIEKSKS